MRSLGPTLRRIRNGQYGGCNTCTPVVTVNSSTGVVTKPVEFYTLGHYSKYVFAGCEEDLLEQWHHDRNGGVSQSGRLTRADCLQ